MLLFLALACQNKGQSNVKEEGKTIPTVEAINHQYFYDIIIDSLTVETYQIKEGERFTDILQKHGLEIGEIFKIKESAKEQFNFNRVKTNHQYYLIKDKNDKLHYFVYDISVTDYAVCKLGDEIDIYLGSNDVEIIEQSFGGFIDSSLYAVLEHNNIHESVGDALVDIYGWTVDFYKLQKGDYFQLIYDEKIVNNKSAGVSTIKAALINHKGQDYYAFRYMTKDSVISYYDKEGKSINGVFLKSPVKYGRITSRYTLKRYHPVEHKEKAHLGTDYASPLKSPIRATADGTILEVAYNPFNGNYVKIEHNDSYTTGYLHMSETARGIRPGVEVLQGDVIGYVGTTGSSSGPHVCYRFWKNGNQVDHILEKTKMLDGIPFSELSEYWDYVLQLSIKLNGVDMFR
ncbi:MAG: peptidoglycan DD-metalloendopeptidase family protein [Chitinophagales bacterium]